MSQGQSQDVSYIQGYLYKKTRDGRWQKRWFETTGCFLTYYKSKKMTKLLAALNLPQVGEIKLVPDSECEDPAEAGCLFSIHLNDRDYLLKAGDPASAGRWVEVLCQLKNGSYSNASPQVKSSTTTPPSSTWSKTTKALFPCCATDSASAPPAK